MIDTIRPASPGVDRGTRASIVAAAVELIVTEGVQAFTVAAVARRANVSKGGLLYHFPSQRCLCDELVDQAVIKLTQVAAQRPVGSCCVNSADIKSVFDAEIVAGLLLSFATTRALRLRLARGWRCSQSTIAAGPMASDDFGQVAIQQLALWILRRSEMDEVWVQ